VRIVSLYILEEDGDCKLFGYIACSCSYEYAVNEVIERPGQSFIPMCPRCHCAVKVTVVQNDINTIERLGYGVSDEERDIMLLTAK
jgi:hypothetical protein